MQYCRTHGSKPAMISALFEGDQEDLYRCVQYAASLPSEIMATLTSRVFVLMPSTAILISPADKEGIEGSTAAFDFALLNR